MSTRHPEILWAQRSDRVFLTVELPDANNAKVHVDSDGRFTFTAMAKEAVKYETAIQLYGRVKVAESRITEGRRHTFCLLMKEDPRWWERLLQKDGKAPPFVKADWNRWVDEEDEEGDGQTGIIDDELPQMEIVEDSDDDDEEVPEDGLRKAEV